MIDRCSAEYLFNRKILLVKSYENIFSLKTSGPIWSTVGLHINVVYHKYGIPLIWEIFVFIMYIGDEVINSTIESPIQPIEATIRMVVVELMETP